MIRVDNISKSFGQDYIFKNVSFVIERNDKIGIVGKNGIGKSTLLKSIVFEEYLNSGEVIVDGTIGYLDQNILNNINHSVYKEFIDIFPEFRKLSNFEFDDDKYEKFIEYEQSFDIKGGYEYLTKINKLMTGFGFLKEDINRNISSFSGGEQTKIAFIKLLLLDFDYLFLDEPTNHLDIQTITWLEKYLKELKTSVIVVSHDRFFLDNICNKIIELDNMSIEVYKTNFTNYLKQKKLNYSIRLKEYENNLKLKKKYEEFIIKNRGKPSKIGQVNDRKKKFEQLDNLQEPQKPGKNISFEFEGYHLKKATYIDFFNVCIGYENKSLIDNFNFKVYGGDKIAIIGKNGQGKTSLMNSILSRKVIDGKIKIPSNIKIGYIDQKQDILSKGMTVFETIEKKGNFESTTAIRKYLGKFLFFQEDVYKKIESLSGGERVRVTLAIIGLEKYDILLLDEPTNHLDFETRNTLVETLRNFPGTIIFITHDRMLINELAKVILEVEDGKINEYDGNWNCYLNLKKEKKLEKKKEIVKKEKKTNNKKTSKKVNLQKVQILEEKLFELEQEKEELLEKQLQKNTLQNYEIQKKIIEKIDRIDKQLKNLYLEYENCFN